VWPFSSVVSDKLSGYVQSRKRAANDMQKIFTTSQSSYSRWICTQSDTDVVMLLLATSNSILMVVFFIIFSFIFNHSVRFCAIVKVF